MDQVHVIRHKVLVEGRSIRAVAQEPGFSRNTVRKYLAQSEPRRVERVARRRPVLERVQRRLEELVGEWSSRFESRKQPLTATRIHRQLIAEGYAVGVTLVKQYLRERRLKRQEVYVPLVHRAGDEAQVDFFEVTVEVAGELLKAWLFLVRLMYSGKDFAWLYERCDQLSFLDGHVRAFEKLGGVPARLVYDNLTLAVKHVLVGGRELTRDFQRLVSHYLFEPCFARPGEGHDKGGVEGRGRQLRLQQLVPLRSGATLKDVAQGLLEDLGRDENRLKDAQGRTVAQRFAEEAPLLRALPSVPFAAQRIRLVAPNAQSLVRVEGETYSVPSSWKGRDTTAYVRVDAIVLKCDGESVEHERVRRRQRKVSYRHYLPELARKPQALRQVAPELVAELGEPFGELWSVLAGTHGARRAAQVFAAILAASMRQGEDAVRAALTATLASGEQDVLKLLRGLEPKPAPLHIAVPEPLAAYEVERTSAAEYDALLADGGGR